MTRSEPPTILLVEDELAHARLVELNLRRAGLHNDLVMLDNGKKALEFLFSEGSYVEQLRPNPLLVLLDLNMPGINGYQVLQRLKNSEVTKHIPVIILTTTDDQGEIDKCYKLGCNVYITKPIAYEKFAATIRELGLFIQTMAVPYCQYLT